jgi:hypothetical protein
VKSLLVVFSIIFSTSCLSAVSYVEQTGLYKKYKSATGAVKYKLVQVENNTEACLYQANKACHPSWGSMPIGNYQNVTTCGYYHITSGQDENGNLLYEIGNVFDGTQLKNNVWLCPKTN